MFVFHFVNYSFCVSRFAERVMFLSPEMRTWKIYLGRKWNEKEQCYENRRLKEFEYLERAKGKGITDLSNVRIHFDATKLKHMRELQRAVPLMKSLEDKIIGLDVPNPPYELLSLDLPYLENFKLNCFVEDDSHDDEAAGVYIFPQNHVPPPPLRCDICFFPAFVTT